VRVILGMPSFTGNLLRSKAKAVDIVFTVLLILLLIMEVIFSADSLPRKK
jgi:hypothetical protein